MAETKSSQKFLFLEFLDPAINGLLLRLRREFTGEDPMSGIHVTVRGPYKGRIRESAVKRFQRLLEGEPILIHGIGMFSNPDEFVVYIKVSSDRLRRIWWKPDYPKNQYGINPHISLYRGCDKVLAEKIRCFLNAEGLSLVCTDFRLTPYTSKQSELFTLESLPVEYHFLRLSNVRVVKADIIQRAEKLVRTHYKMCSERRTKIDSIQ